MTSLEGGAGGTTVSVVVVVGANASERLTGNPPDVGTWAPKLFCGGAAKAGTCDVVGTWVPKLGTCVAEDVGEKLGTDVGTWVPDEVTGGGGGMVPITGEDIIGGTMGTTDGGVVVVVVPPIFVGFGWDFVGSDSFGAGKASTGILCRYPYPMPHPRLPSPPQAPLGVIDTSLQ